MKKTEEKVEDISKPLLSYEISGEGEIEMLKGKFTFSFKITIKWNLAKSHATRLTSAKYKFM